MRHRWEDMSDAEFRAYVTDRIEEVSTKVGDVDTKVGEVLTILKLGKVGAEVIRWCAGLGAAVATIWGAWHIIGPKV